MQAAGGAGVQASQFVAAQGVQVVISGAYGPNAFDTLEAAGIAAYLAPSGGSYTVADAGETFPRQPARAGQGSLSPGASRRAARWGLIRIAVASGKGGTGKTTVATNLALALEGATTGFLDCDVEAPNAHLFLKPEFDQREDVGILIPEIDEARCTYCGRCAEVCQFHAIAVIGKKTLVFPELCHGCGSCTLVCPENAILKNWT